MALRLSVEETDFGPEDSLKRRVVPVVVFLEDPRVGDSGNIVVQASATCLRLEDPGSCSCKKVFVTAASVLQKPLPKLPNHLARGKLQLFDATSHYRVRAVVVYAIKSDSTVVKFIIVNDRRSGARDGGFLREGEHFNICSIFSEMKPERKPYNLAIFELPPSKVGSQTSCRASDVFRYCCQPDFRVQWPADFRTLTTYQIVGYTSVPLLAEAQTLSWDTAHAQLRRGTHPVDFGRRFAQISVSARHDWEGVSWWYPPHEVPRSRAPEQLARSLTNVVENIKRSVPDNRGRTLSRKPTWQREYQEVDYGLILGQGVDSDDIAIATDDVADLCDPGLVGGAWVYPPAVLNQMHAGPSTRYNPLVLGMHLPCPDFHPPMLTPPGGVHVALMYGSHFAQMCFNEFKLS